MTYRMICEFENSLAGHLGQVGTPSGGVIYRPGKFGKGVQIAEATTNLVINPSAETSISGWSATGCTVTRESGGMVGDYCFGLAQTSDSAYIYSGAISGASAAAGTVYTASCYVKGIGDSIGKTVRISPAERGGATAVEYYRQDIVLSDQWQRLTSTMTVQQSDRTQVDVLIQIIGSAPYPSQILIDAIQFEAKAYATPYCDGSLGAGHSWSGTAHGSTSARTAATLTYPAAVIDGEEGAVSMWVNHASNTGAGMGLFGSGADGQFEASTGATGAITFNVNSTSLTTTATIAAGVWNHLAFTWSASQNKREIFINGVLAASRQYDSGFTLGATVLAFHRPYLSATINGVGDQFAIVDRAITAAEVSRLYNGGAGLGYYEFLYALATAANFTTSVRLNGSWVDITAYTQAASWDLGFSGAYEVIARGETLNLTLLNRDRRFSPENPTGAYYPYFTKNADIKVEVEQDGVTQTMFYGQVDLIEPEGDTLGNRTAKVECIGLLNRLQNIMVNIGVQEGKRADEIVASILHDCNFTANVTGVWRLGVTGYTELNTTAVLGESKEIFEYEPGETTFAVVGDDWNEDTSAYGAIRDVVGQEYGRLWVNRAGQFKFWGRHHFVKNTTSVMEFNGSHIKAMGYDYGAEVVNEVIVVARPRRVGSSPEVLAKLDTPQAVQVRPMTAKTITFRYKDQDTGLEIGGKNAITPQKGLDFFATGTITNMVNGVEVQTEVDMLGVMTATITSESGSSCTVEFYNADATVEAWIQPNAQLRGTKITGTAQVESKARDETSITTYGLSRFRFPYNLDQIYLAESMARFLLNQRKTPTGVLKSITLPAHASPSRMAMALDRTIGDRITFSEPQTGVAGDYFILSESWQLQEKQVMVQWQLTPATDHYWLLGQAGYTELNSTTILTPL